MLIHELMVELWIYFMIYMSKLRDFLQFYMRAEFFIEEERTFFLF